MGSAFAIGILSLSYDLLYNYLLRWNHAHTGFGHRALKRHPAGFKVPKFVTFVDALPKNPSGKILERELRSEYANLAAG
ncbi:hypothetical protein [Nocardia sp. NPDC127526]|uniref:hypothetical protein n=1 Tax=Nocardia sp. NPDC127526 TaxID=3345393 RepID=UPI0036446414